MNSKWCKFIVFTAKVTWATLRCNVFLTFSYPSHLKHLVLRAFWEDCLPEMLSKLGVLAERGMKKSTKTSRHSSGGPGRLWRSGSALGGSGGALGGPGRALGGSIYRKTRDQPHSGRYVNPCSPKTVQMYSSTGGSTCLILSSDLVRVVCLVHCLG